MNLVLCSENNNVINAIKSLNKYNIIADMNDINDLYSITANNHIDTVLITRKVKCNSNIIDFILRYKTNNPNIRIIFLTSADLNNIDDYNDLNRLVKSEIYDIFYDGNINLGVIKDLLDNPRGIEDVKEILKKRTELRKQKENKTQNQENIIKFEEGVSNIIAVTSIKPGTGKSFVASNLAVTMALYGEKNNGTKPRILLVEGDFQTCSVYTLMGVKDNQYNIRSCLNYIKDDIEKNGLDSFLNKPNSKTIEFIDKSCIQIDWCNNLYVLEGHNFEDMEKVDPEHYYYLISYLSEKYDYIIIDANSNIRHETTDPIFQLANSILFIYTTDYNDIQTNINCYNKLKKMNLLNKSTYILNKNLSNEEEKEFKKRFNFNDKEILEKTINTKYVIPEINTAIMYNANYNHKPICTENTYYTLPARIEFLEIANKYLKLKNLDNIIKEVEKLKNNY